MLPLETFTFLSQPLSSLKGVGDARAKLLNNLLSKAGQQNARMIDAIAHRPLKVLIRKKIKYLYECTAGDSIIASLVIEEHLFPPARSRAPIRVIAGDGVDSILLQFFGGDRKRIQAQMPLSSKKLIIGDVEYWNGHKLISHPAILNIPSPLAGEGARRADEGFSFIPEQELIYPLTAGLFNSHMRRVVEQVLFPLKNEAIPEWIVPSLISQKKWPNFIEAMHILHSVPDVLNDTPALILARQRLAYDELLSYELGIALMRRKVVSNKTHSNIGLGHLRQALRNALPYSLTGAQERAIETITTAMSKRTRMLQLLQGDVGSGKTIVALFAMLAAVETGGQAVLMAPTDLLARQHVASLEKLLKPLGLEVGLLTGKGSASAAHRNRTLKKIENGTLQIIIGTHAVFQDAVNYKDLRLAVIDEQHKFGVTQRLELASKGNNTDILVMSATPIPRTLVLTLYGDMDVCVLDEKPIGRKDIHTSAISLSRMNEIIAAVQRAIIDGRQIYWVCPLVSDSELIDLAAAEERADHLRQVFDSVFCSSPAGKLSNACETDEDIFKKTAHPNPLPQDEKAFHKHTIVGLVHGKMPNNERDEVMAQFKSGTLKILVATTVIEVGVDVPNASVMVIEHAERFGLAQLHQIRGRVGRGDTQSNCILLYKEPLSPNARARLTIMRETNDGFLIAEEDLRLRGAGEILGTKQSGLPEFLFANFETDINLLAAAKDQIKMILEYDPKLETPTGLLLKEVLKLYGKDKFYNTLKAG